MIAVTLDPTPNGNTTANGEHAARATDTPPPSGRDARGRFTKNNPGGPGNPFARQSAAFHQAVRAAVSKEQMLAITNKLTELALAGNLTAIKLLFAYTAGRPREAVDADTLDIQEWALWRQAPAMLQEMPGVVQSLTAEHACLLAREIQPEVSADLVTQVAQGMQKRNERDAAATARKQARTEQKAAAAPMQTETTEEKPVATPEQPPTRNGDNGSDRYAHRTPEELVEEIRSGRYQQAQAPAAEMPTARKGTEEKPVEIREMPKQNQGANAPRSPSPNGGNGSVRCAPPSAGTATATKPTEQKRGEIHERLPSPSGGNGSGRYDHMTAEEILEEIRSGRYLLPPEEARRARQAGRQQQTGTDTNGDNGG
jgi:hypothetical protein